MVTVHAPLFSMDARGSLGKSLVFAKSGKTNYAKKHFSPGNPQSAKQTGIRLGTKFVTQTWRELTADQKDTWTSLANLTSSSKYHAYLTANLRRWRDGLLPKAIDSALTSPTISVNTFYWWFAGDQIQYLTQLTTGTDQGFCVELAISDTPGILPNTSDVCVLRLLDRFNSTMYSKTDLIDNPFPGTPYLFGRANLLDGTSTPWTALTQM